MGKSRLLIIEDDPEMRGVLSLGLSHNGYTVFTAKSAKEGLTIFGEHPFDLVLADLRFPGEDGLHLVETIKSKSLQTPVIIVTANGSVQNAVEVMRKGAFDYLLKPVSIKALEERISTALREGFSPSQEDSKAIPEEEGVFLTRNRKMKEIVSLCERIAASNVPVLIQGESGTGKELIARYIHRKSPRRQKPFVAVNCASLPESLFESELFGHEKGAFTGALCKKIGKFERAHQGTLLLDEVTEMSPFLQAKLLRVIQESEVDRIGGLQPIPVDVRVIATTNQKIEDLIEKGDFREDLYFRLNVISLQLLPLRERKEDIELLAHHFLKKFSTQYGRPELSFSNEVLNWFCQQPWRGNVRELKNVIERAVLSSFSSQLDIKDFCKPERMEVTAFNGGSDPPYSLREMEKDLIFKTLHQTQGNRTQAAKILGISIRTLRNKLHEYQEGASQLRVTDR